MSDETNKKLLTIESAYAYVKRGWAVIPIPYQSKIPVITGWQKLKILEAELPNYFNGRPKNIGVVLGEKSGGLVDIDLDSPEAVKLAPWFLPTTEAVFGRKSKAASHWLYFCENGEYQKFNNPLTVASSDKDQRKEACIVEIRTNKNGKGIQTVFPPSVHECGELIGWESDGEPSKVIFSDLKESVSKLASASLLASLWRSGIRHHLALAVSGALLRHRFKKEDVKHFLKAICTVANDEELSDRLQAVEDCAEAISKGEKAYGFPKLTELTDEKVVKSVCEWLEIQYNEQPVTENSFADQPKPLDFSLKPVEKFDNNCLPKVLVNWLSPASRVIGCPIDFLVLSAIVTAGSLLGARMRVMPVRNSDWAVVPNLYGGVVGFPSTKKTPALDEIQRPILELQRKAREKFKDELRDYEIKLRFFEKDEKAIFNKAKSADEAKEQLDDLHKPIKPILRRFQTNDATTPKLIQFLSENPVGMMLFRDELIGWLRSMENDYEKSARAFILESAKGAIPYELARVDGREIQLESGTLSIIGGIQPSKLQRFVSEAYSLDNSDGFLQRLTLVYPDLIYNKTRPTGNDYELLKHGYADANRAFQRLAERDFKGNCVSPNGDKYFVVKFQPDAQIIAEKWRYKIEDEAERIQTNDEAFAAYLYKLPKTCFAIALVFHGLENVGSNMFPDEISKETTLRAIAYTDYLISHAKRVFALGENEIFDLGRKLTGRIKNGDLPQGFTQRQIMRKKWSGFRSAEDVTEVLSLLVEYGYLRGIRTTEGRATTKFHYHPSLVPSRKDETKGEHGNG